MRVTFSTCEDFCHEMRRQAAAGHIRPKEIRVRIDRAPEQDDEVTFGVAIWGTFIIRSPDGDFLMEYGEWCGADDLQRGSKTPTAGTDAANLRKAMIERAAVECGLEAIRGKLEAV
jgi:hypothetical protein